MGGKHRACRWSKTIYNVSRLIADKEIIVKVAKASTKHIATGVDITDIDEQLTRVINKNAINAIFLRNAIELKKDRIWVVKGFPGI